MIDAFTYVANPSRVVFGAGRIAELGAELERLSVRRALLLCTPGRSAALAETVNARLGGLAGGIYARATMHTPVEVTSDALEQLRELDCDGLVALGGGSAIGLGKALALRTDLPQIAVPTTYAGSEMTPILGETEGGRKTTRRSPQVLPETILYDVELTLSLPPALSATSGVNAMAHAVEALYARDANPVTSMLAEAGLAALARSLPRIVRDPADRDARTDALYGAWLCSACLGSVGVGLHHKLCHTLGGAFGLGHSETHTVMLPHVTRYNAKAAPRAMQRIVAALGPDGAADDAAAALFALNRRLGAPAGLRELGMPEAGIERAVELAMQDQYPNPRPPEADALRAMLHRAWAGEPPAPA